MTTILVLAALGGVGYAVVKHFGLSNLKADVLAEVAKLEASAAKVESAVKADIAASIAKIKSLL